MWLPQLLQALNEGEMQTMGMKLTAAQIYSVNQGSLKDAIVHFGGFCTSEVISKQGLLLTNHHCGYGQIQSHTTLEKNYLKNGFWAKNFQEELSNPGLFARFIVRIDDVTEAILTGVTDKMTVNLVRIRTTGNGLDIPVIFLYLESMLDRITNPLSIAKTISPTVRNTFYPFL